MPRFLELTLVLATVAAIAACGGGGKKSSSTPTSGNGTASASGSPASGTKVSGSATDASGGGTVNPDSIIKAGPELLRAAGLNRTKAQAMVDLAHDVNQRRVDLARHGRMSDLEIVKDVSSVKGIGPWTAQMYLISTMSRHDVWPTGDYGVRVGWSILHGLDETISESELRECSASCDPPDRLVGLIGEPQCTVRTGHNPEWSGNSRSGEVGDHSCRGDAANLIGASLGEPQRAIGTRGNAVGVAASTGDGELHERSLDGGIASGQRVKTTDPVAGVFGKPDVVIGTVRNAHRPSACRQRELGHGSRRGDTSDPISPELGEPEVTIDCLNDPHGGSTGRDACRVHDHTAVRHAAVFELLQTQTNA